MHIMNAHVSCLRRTVTSHSASDVKNLITWSDSAERINAVSSAWTNITLRSAWCLWIKDVALTAMKIMNSEDASVSNDNSRWNKYLKSIETNCSDIQKRLNTIAHSCNSWTLRCLQALQIQWTFRVQWTFWIQWILWSSRILSAQWTHRAQRQLCWKHAV